jgi:hypothetical protein
MSTAVTRTEELEYADIAGHLISDEEIETRIARYEKAFGMSSEEFADKWQRGRCRIPLRPTPGPSCLTSGERVSLCGQRAS